MTSGRFTPAQVHELLDELVSRFEDRLHELTLKAFLSMQAQTYRLTVAQSQWIINEAERLGLIDESSQNLWSGKTPAEQARIRGREVPTPAVLLDRPLKPPRRAREPY
jgi:hypothetical protein